MAKYRPIRAQLNSLQGRYAKQDSDLMTRFMCAVCSTSYYAEKPKCPLCDTQKRLAQTQEALTQMTREVEAQTNLNRRLAEQLEGSHAIKGALALLDDNDTAFLKTVLYQWKIDRSVNLRVTHSGTKNTRRRTRANGFVAIFRGAPEPIAHVCTSIGGTAIAEYYEEGLNEKGHPQAMNMLLKGFSELLPGALE